MLQISLQDLVCSLCLAVSLWVIDCRHFGFCSHGCTDHLPVVGCEEFVSVSNDHDWNSVVSDQSVQFLFFILFYSYSDLAGEPCRTSRYILFFPRKPLEE